MYSYAANASNAFGMHPVSFLPAETPQTQLSCWDAFRAIQNQLHLFSL